MKRTKKILSVLLALFVIVGAVRLPLTADAATEGGMTFEDTTRMYYTDKVMSTAPKTLEAVIKNPATMYEDDGTTSKRGGVIIGNYDGGKNSMNLEIYTWGAPRIVGYNNGKYYSAIFYNARTEIWAGQETHVAIVFESANTVSCYINGVLKETKTLDGITSYMEQTQSTWVLGNDHRYNKAEANYKGTIKSVALYSDVRTADEIKTDATSYGSDNLLLRYDMSSYTSNPAVVPDLSGNGMNASYERWVAPKDQPSVGEYDYAFAVVGDTQMLNNYKTDTFQLAPLYNWIKDNAASKKIKHVFGLGDITENQTDAEYAHAVENIKKLNGVVPYSLVRGNHDNGDEKFTNNFNYEGYTSQISGRFSESSLNNTWKEFTVGSLKYLVLCLDYGAQDDVLAWAGNVIEAHPEHNVIITTHAYLYRDGTTIDDVSPKDQACPTNSNSANNNGDDIWEELGKKYANITLILSGHDPNNDIVVTQTKGDHGNTVTQMLIDPQGMDANMGPTGMVAMLYFSNNGKTINVQYYSTIRDKYWPESRTFTVNSICAHVGATEHKAVEATCTSAGHEAYTYCEGCKTVIVGEDKEIAKLAHDFTHYEAKQPTHTEDGNIEYWYCSECELNYKDAEGKEVVDDEKLPATKDEHVSTGTYVYDSTEHWIECACGVKVNTQKHTFDNTCDTTCNGCAYTREITHTWESKYTTNDEKHWIECSVCDAKKDEAVHTGGTATCADKAACSVCDKKYGSTIDHLYIEKVEAKYLKDKATCKDYAVYYKSCSMCGVKGTETFNGTEKDPENHVGGTVLKGELIETCETTGYTGDKCCKGCDKVLEAGMIIDKLPHEISSWTVVTEPTTTTEGAKKGTCTECNKEYTVKLSPLVTVLNKDAIYGAEEVVAVGDTKLPAEVILTANDVTNNLGSSAQALVDRALANAKKEIEGITDKYKFAHILDIKMLLLESASNGDAVSVSEYELTGPVEITLTIPSDVSKKFDNLVLLHIKDDGTVEKVDFTYVSTNKVKFQADGFSYYAFAGTEKATSPATGDSNQIFLWSAMMVVALVGATTVVIKKRKYQ